MWVCGVSGCKENEDQRDSQVSKQIKDHRVEDMCKSAMRTPHYVGRGMPASSADFNAASFLVTFHRLEKSQVWSL